ncbi:hypothetical protein [Streptomyces hirsutus]|uniref:hypothetical protein n=1 Tax=Streptomyces hirsutus TaxID=35620 RepID=UPI000A6EDCC4|nr:hypothetical protein [Streptomyces hirsutus]
MLPTINEFLDRRTVPGKGVPLYVLRGVCFRWARENGGPFIDIETLEAQVKARGARIGLRADGEPQVLGIRLLPADAPDNVVPNAAGAAEAMHKIAQRTR